MELLKILLFALAVSADGFMVGIAYGLKRISLPWFSLIIISAASALAVTFSMLCGQGLAFFLSPVLARGSGAVMLILVGIYFFICACREKISTLPEEKKTIVSFNIKSLGIIVQILKEPDKADFDASGVISSKEAFFLGIALAMDAFGAGLGAAMTGFNILFTATLVGMLKFILIKTGFFVGGLVKSQKYKYLSALASGFIFITIGMSEFF
ncbi:sporulation membrane protein YtaF [Thermosyntropha sp.]|uniref:sporulation membrane protein YtaF n=1 Tax=Thermosyntropha sp. TaxID=2740820 RepID=UPI0025FD9E2E|nr:sporulation membrane protein YtaF [Thermosyntropha sp.]MBO8158884.1 sporulation membrane protein YtaF [Thermosyntropha sp.]